MIAKFRGRVKNYSISFLHFYTSFICCISKLIANQKNAVLAGQRFFDCGLLLLCTCANVLFQLRDDEFALVDGIAQYIANRDDANQFFIFQYR